VSLLMEDLLWRHPIRYLFSTIIFEKNIIIYRDRLRHQSIARDRLRHQSIARNASILNL